VKTWTASEAICGDAIGEERVMDPEEVLRETVCPGFDSVINLTSGFIVGIQLLQDG
jgi:hypothetical protein